MPALNRLADETSPYLRQHAENPVAWQPWGGEAFAEARRRDVPVLLSVGYSACHWCHVMAHESFEDDAVAEVVNDLFVAIKVDREERPDVDAVYMEATQAMTGSGGWPMTVFMTPEGEPFFCGTYFPRERRQGMPGFLDVCTAIDDAWKNRRSELAEQAAKLSAHLQRTLSAAPGANPIPGREAVDAAVAGLLALHDDDLGGFGGAPKFPQPASVELLLRHAAGPEGDGPALRAATTTLDSMAAGGIYDHLGGGFARYSVDAHWLAPHFEKMLYDQALLVRTYLHAWQLTGAPRHRQVLDETITYVLRDLRHPGGGFFSAEDADSEGEEGRFYLWTPEQIRAALGPDEAAAAIEWWGVTEPGNFEGRTILNRLHARGVIERPPLIQDCRIRLFDVRAERVRPGLDDKVLTEWNGLMLASLAEAAAATDNRTWLEAAITTGEFLCRRLRTPEGRWLRSWQGTPDPDDPGRARHDAFAADHAALIDGFTRLAEASGEARWIAVARATADVLLALFRDAEGSGFFTTGSDGEALVARPKDLQDGATPSANSNAAWALLRLAALTGEDSYRAAGEEVLALLGPLVAEHGSAFAHLAAALDLHAQGPTEVVVPGHAPDLVAAAHHRWLPTGVLAWGEPYASPLWKGRQEGHAYVCRGYTCQAPTTDPRALAAQLDGT